MPSQLSRLIINRPSPSPSTASPLYSTQYPVAPSISIGQIVSSIAELDRSKIEHLSATFSQNKFTLELSGSYRHKKRQHQNISEAEDYDDVRNLIISEEESTVDELSSNTTKSKKKKKTQA